MDLYREEILEHWRNPQNFGEMKKTDLVIDQVNPLCGDAVRFFFKFSSPVILNSIQDLKKIPDQVRNDRKEGSSRPFNLLRSFRINKQARTIKDVSFTGNGCAISIASASIISEFIKGKKVSVLSKITGEDVLVLIGGTVTSARLKCAFLPLEVIKRVVGSR